MDDAELDFDDYFVDEDLERELAVEAFGQDAPLEDEPLWEPELQTTSPTVAEQKSPPADARPPAVQESEPMLPLSQQASGELAAAQEPPKALVDVVETVGQGPRPPKRRRYLVKTTPPGASRPTLPFVSPVADGGSVVRTLFPQDVSSWWLQKNDQEKYDYVYNKLRRSYSLFIYARSHGYGPQENLPETWPKSMTLLEDEDKKLFVHWWTVENAGKEKSEVISWAKEYGFKTKVGRRRGTFRTPQVLLTYQGDWGVLKLSSQPASDADWPKLVQELKESPKVKDLWDEISAEFAALGKKVRAEDVAVALELCLQTLSAGGGVRLHVHACFRSTAALQFQTLEDFTALGSKPHCSMSRVTGPLRKRASDWQPYYYLAAPKKKG